jgi:hypothetical protein
MLNDWLPRYDDARISARMLKVAPRAVASDSLATFF